MYSRVDWTNKIGIPKNKYIYIYIRRFPSTELIVKPEFCVLRMMSQWMLPVNNHHKEWKWRKLAVCICRILFKYAYQMTDVPDLSSLIAIRNHRLKWSRCIRIRPDAKFLIRSFGYFWARWTEFYWVLISGDCFFVGVPWQTGRKLFRNKRNVNLSSLIEIHEVSGKSCLHSDHLE